MAQFQILCAHSANEWRAITADFQLAPSSDQQYLWSSFEAAEMVRRRLLQRSPSACLRVALAGAPDDDVGWQTREKLRFADGHYAPTPWHDEGWYQARHDEHYCHISTEQTGKIAFTENAAKGRADRQLVMSPGRYLQRFFADHLDNEAIEGWCARLSVLLEDNVLKITQDADEIEDVYVGGPRSCMAHSAASFDSLCHPTRIYAGPDTALAYIGVRDDAKARSIIWPARRIYTSIYGDVSRLRLLLEAAGYSEGSLSGARIRRIENGEHFVVPYIDAGGDLADAGDCLVIGHGSIASESTTGLGHFPWYCPRCDEDASPHADVHFSDGACEEWCYGCYDDHAIICDHDGRAYSDAEIFVTVLAGHGEFTILADHAEDFGAVYLDDRGEWWSANCCRLCDASGIWFHLDDLVDYHGEWLSEDALPDPIDDNDPACACAHVIARRRFENAVTALAAEAGQQPAAGAGAEGGSDGCPWSLSSPSPALLAARVPALASASARA